MYTHTHTCCSTWWSPPPLHLSVPLASSTSLAISVAPVTQCVIHRHFVLSPAKCVYMVSDNLYSTRHCQHTACDYLCHLVRAIVKRLGLDKNLIVLYRHRYQHWQLTKQFIWILWFSFTSLCNRLILIVGPCLKIQTYAFKAIYPSVSQYLWQSVSLCIDIQYGKHRYIFRNDKMCVKFSK